MLDYNMKPFRFWCQKVLPLVYDDSLSYMELLCKVVNYLNHIIEDINGIPDYINQLISEDKLKEIMTELMDELREQVARANEGTNTTASYDRSTGELVWLDGKLVRMTRNILAGDRYVEDTGTEGITGNFVYTSVEMELTRVKDALASEAQTRESADTLLQGNIDAEALARAQDDTQLQTNIDNEAQAREDADGQLQEDINNLEETVNNLDINHVYNQSTPTSGLTTNIGLKEGTYSITENTTINAQLVIPKGAIINVASGITLTINGQILAGRYQIFSGDGNVTVDNSKQSFGYPEWFGAIADGTTDSTNAINKCLATFKETRLASGDYLTTDTIKIENSDTVLYGVSLTYSKLYNTGGTRIVLNDGTKTILQVGQDTYVSDTQQLHVTVEHLTLARSVSGNTGSKGLLCQYNQSTRLSDIRVTSSAYSFYYNGAIRPITYDCQAIIENIVSDATEYCGYEIYNSTHITMSAYFEKCTSENYQQYTEQSVALRLEGSIISDVFIDKLECANFTYGIVVSGSGITSNIGAQDIFIRDCVLDMIKNIAIYIPTMPDSVMVNVTGCYLSHGNVSGGEGLITVSNSHGGITIKNNQLCETLASASIGILCTDCKGLVVKDNIIKDADVASVSINSSSFCECSNTIMNYNNSATYGTYANNISKSIFKDICYANSATIATGFVITNATSCEIDISKISATAIGNVNGTTITGATTVDTNEVIGVA